MKLITIYANEMKTFAINQLHLTISYRSIWDYSKFFVLEKSKCHNSLFIECFTSVGNILFPGDPSKELHIFIQVESRRATKDSRINAISRRHVFLVSSVVSRETL